MSRNTSLTFREAVYGQETGEAFILLLELDHPDLANPIRVSSDSVDTSHNGSTYVAFPFDIALPDDTDENTPTARLTIDNVSREIVQAVRTVTGPVNVNIKIVLGSDTETVEAEFPDFQLRDVRYNVLTVEGQLNIESFAQEPFPAGTFTPASFAGLFAFALACCVTLL
jgi:hypothetical protein